MTKKIFLLLSLTFISCNEADEKLYYQSGNPEKFDFYSNEEKPDSSIVYYDHYKHPIKRKKYWDDSTSYVKNYSLEGLLTSEGRYNNESNRIGKWTFYANDTVKVFEYKNIRGEEYLNQSWVKNAKGDTIGGHYFSLRTKDTIKVNEFINLRFFLESPILSTDSELLLLLPKTNRSFSSDFSNEHEIEVDTIFNLKYDSLNNHLKEMPLNHMLMVNLEFASTGKKQVRGILKETDKKVFNDSTSLKVRNIYIDKTFIVKKDI